MANAPVWGLVTPFTDTVCVFHRRDRYGVISRAWALVCCTARPAVRRFGGSAAQLFGGSAVRWCGGAEAWRLGGSAVRWCGGAAAQLLAGWRFGGSKDWWLGGLAARSVADCPSGAAPAITPALRPALRRRRCHGYPGGHRAGHFQGDVRVTSQVRGPCAWPMCVTCLECELSVARALPGRSDTDGVVAVQRWRDGNRRRGGWIGARRRSVLAGGTHAGATMPGDEGGRISGSRQGVERRRAASSSARVSVYR